MARVALLKQLEDFHNDILPGMEIFLQMQNEGSSAAAPMMAAIVCDTVKYTALFQQCEDYKGDENDEIDQLIKATGEKFRQLLQSIPKPSS